MSILNTFQQQFHPMLPRPNHDERSRQEFAKSLRGYIQSQILPGLMPLYRKIMPDTSKRPTRAEVRAAMEKQPYFQFYASLNRVAQELMWHSVIDTIERDLPRMEAEAERLEGTIGSLKLNPEMEVPRYVTEVDIHCMPGGYAAEFDRKGIAAGALYDRGVYLYSMGYGGPFNDDKGRSFCNYIKRNFRGFEPKRILDMGCTMGFSTLPYKELFPAAEVWGIDVAAPLVRYAHLRAAGLGVEIHFAQMNAEKTDFPDEHFDLVVSHILLHETSGKALPRVMKECFRLLRSGGYMIHADLPPFDRMDPLNQFILDNETYYNNEPFWSAMRDMDLVALAKEAGFDPESVRFDTAPMAIREFSKATGYDQGKTEQIAKRDFKAGEFAPGGGWEVLIARKP